MEKKLHSDFLKVRDKIPKSCLMMVVLLVVSGGDVMCPTLCSVLISQTGLQS